MPLFRHCVVACALVRGFGAVPPGSGVGVVTGGVTFFTTFLTGAPGSAAGALGGAGTLGVPPPPVAVPPPDDVEPPEPPPDEEPDPPPEDDPVPAPPPCRWALWWAPRVPAGAPPEPAKLGRKVVVP